MKEKILYFLFISLLLCGCIKEDRSDCPEPKPSLFTYFSYKGDGTEEIFQEKIDNICLFIFDDQELYVDRIDLTKSNLQDLQGVYLDLPEGTYEVVCWGNTSTNTNIEENGEKIGCQLNHRADIDDLDIESSDPLYYGSKFIQVTNQNEIDTIHFVSAHIKMNLAIINSGIHLAKSNSKSRILINENTRLKVEIGNLSESVDFDLNYSTIKMAYLPILTQVNDNQISAKFNVLRFQDRNDVYIRLRDANTNEQIFNMWLSEFMQKYNIKVTGINEAEVNIAFIFNGTSVSIQLWDEEDIKPGM